MRIFLHKNTIPNWPNEPEEKLLEIKNSDEINVFDKYNSEKENMESTDA